MEGHRKLNVRLVNIPIMKKFLSMNDDMEEWSFRRDCGCGVEEEEEEPPRGIVSAFCGRAFSSTLTVLRAWRGKSGGCGGGIRVE
eukprot:CAMPEP_0118638540 /NCGR_PEP_ID=MMETSP0785-20121206/3743_1 /TAXON_ID=91992 /ORGANISM="Bolidomonas pacifica, Strain CCMP 1866" /LENGTH=84 /DNA_ID=CAMNT_0006529805 /DNA_START=348 /DNA_END=602 /DNA_ORIENTATION=-